MREFSGLLSPYNGCSHTSFTKINSKREASSDYLLRYHRQVAKEGTSLLGLFTKAGV